jgi:hypothetical protein
MILAWVELPQNIMPYDLLSEIKKNEPFLGIPETGAVLKL